MTKSQWAHKELNQPTVYVSPATWGPIVNLYYTPWARHVYDHKRTDLLAPSRQHHGDTWKTLGASTQSIHSTLSTAFALTQYARYTDGTGIRPTRQTLAHSRGYTENGTDGIHYTGYKPTGSYKPTTNAQQSTEPYPSTGSPYLHNYPTNSQDNGQTRP